MIHNESAMTYAWLKEKTGFTTVDSSNLLMKVWGDIRDRMLSVDQQFIYSQDWISDFWLCRSSEQRSGMPLGPKWDPPKKIDDWPALGVHNLVDKNPLPLSATNNKALENLLTATILPNGAGSQAALDRFTAMKAEIKIHADLKMVQVEHVRAWIGTSIGHLLMAVILSPQNRKEELVQLTTKRLALPRDTPLPVGWINEFEERRLEILYNKRLSTVDRFVLNDIKITIGQGEEWREHWDWLSRELAANDMIEAVQLAASLMRCSPLIEGLIKALQSEDEYMKNSAIAVFRRWILTLKVMAWLEDALAKKWKYVRPQDLACFAFNAMKPDWPHRVVALSHRSGDVKPMLTKTKLWTSGRCAIDANYVPSWETNTGMMWGLFAATPFICRIQSPNYAQSVWCNREYEITNYLVKNCDFLSERWVLDLDISELDFLDEMISVTIDYDDPQPELRELFKSFPPMCNVWVPTSMSEWEVKMFRASAALRIMLLEISNPAVTNEVAWLIEGGLQLTQPSPTNNPDGWQTYATIFRDLTSICASDSNGLAIGLPLDYSPEQMTFDIEALQRIPDLSAGIPALGDILVAFEWLRTEWPLMLDEKYGSFLAINCRGLTKEQWLNDERLSLLRGLASIRLSVPVWFLQTAGQDVEDWPMIGERPIFTEHVSNQFSWMLEMSLDRSIMRSRYPDDSGLILSEELKKVCRT